MQTAKATDGNRIIRVRKPTADTLVRIADNQGITLIEAADLMACGWNQLTPKQIETARAEHIKRKPRRFRVTN